MASGRDKYRSSAPSLSEVLADTEHDSAVVTITEVRDQLFDAKGGGQRVAMVIITEEYPDNPLFPSGGKGGGVDRLYDKLGEDQKKWPGERIPLVRVREVYNPSTQERADKFWPARADEWDSILEEFDRAQRPARKSTAKPTARKR